MRTHLVAGLVAASALTLSGCAGAATGPATDGPLAVVASTDVYGQIAQEIGGEDVEVTSLIDSAAQDPHSFEPSARDQLAVSRAALVIENGGGYDPFVDALIEASASTAPVVTAVDLRAVPGDGTAPTDEGDDSAHAAEDDHTEDDHTEDDHADDDGHGHVEGLNEHVWYDPQTVGFVAGAISAELSALRPADADTFAANTATFLEGISGLVTDLEVLKSAADGAEIFVTEPVPLYLTDAAGLVNVAPDAFTEAVEEGQDVPPATLLASLDLLGSDGVRLVVVNAQTGGAETVRIADAAASAGIPVIAFAETLPEGTTYLAWMSDNIAALAGALTG